MAAKFHSSTSINSRDIAVCAKIQDGGRRHLEFIIFVYFWSNGLFPVAAGYITAKFHSYTSIGDQDIAVCAKIQDGGDRHLLHVGPPG